MQQNNFTIIDYIILVSIFVISIFIGLFPSFKFYIKSIISKKSKSVYMKDDCIDEINDLNNDQTNGKNSKLEEYLIGGGKMDSVPVALSILATLFSTTFLIGQTAEVYQYGIQITMSLLPMIFTALIVPILFLPLVRKIKMITLYEYFQMRFNSSFVRVLPAILYILFTIVWVGSVIFSASTSVSVATDINVFICIVSIGTTTIIYTAFGGIRGVIWCDVFQLIVMFSGLFYVLIRGSILVGGFGKVWQLSSKGGRLNFFDFNINPFVRQTFWTIMIGGFFRAFLPLTSDQTILQRYSALKNNKSTAYTLFIINLIGLISLFAVCGSIGLTIYANYVNCDPIYGSSVTGVTNPNQLFAYFVNEKLNTSPGVSGFIQGALLSAALSTISSVLNSQSAVLWQDCLKQFSYFNSFSDTKSVYAAKGLVFVCGTMSILCAFSFSTIDNKNIVEMFVFLVFILLPPIALLFVLGTFFYFVNKFGAILGFLTAFISGFWFLGGVLVVKPKYPKLPTSGECFNITSSSTNMTFFLNNTNYISGEAMNVYGFNKLYSISYHLIPLIIFLIGLLVGIVSSILNGGLNNKVDNDLLIFKRKIHNETL